MAITNLNELAKFVKGGAEVLQKAMESKEETTLEFIEGSFVSNQELETLKTTVREEGKKEGKNIGYDFAMKDLKTDFGLEIEGKDRKAIAEAIKSKIAAEVGKEPSEKVKELSTSLEKLQKQYQTDIEAKESEVNNYKSKIKDIKISSDLAMSMPDGLSIIKPDQFAVLAKTSYTFDYDESGQLIAKKGDQVLKDKLEKPLPIKEILTDFAKQNNWISSNGRGAGNDGSGGGGSDFKTINDVYAHMEKNKIDPMSTDGQKLVEKFYSQT